VHPAAARIAALAEQGFAGIPRPWALVHWDDGTGPQLIASVAEYLPGAQDGWEWMVDDVRAYASGHSDLGTALAPVAEVGTLTARMHVALAATGRDVADDALTAQWEARACADLAEAVLVIDGDEGVRLRARVARIRKVFEAFRGMAGTTLIDVHGDFHVGQVLRHGSPYRYSVTDFDGNPVLLPEDRGTRAPAALDVAGMLASLDHVGRVVIKRTDGVDVEAVHRWIVAAHEAYLGSYRDTLDGLGRVRPPRGEN